jgi:hypothetical protein
VTIGCPEPKFDTACGSGVIPGLQAKEDRMRKNPVAAIWLIGILVAVVAYAANPGHLLTVALDTLAAGFAAVEQMVRSLTLFGSDVVRALAIGLFVTFVALSVLAIREGHRGRTALVIVSTVFVLLVRDDGDGVSNGRWVAAFALAAVAALVMTDRIRRPVR